MKKLTVVLAVVTLMVMGSSFIYGAEGKFSFSIGAGTRGVSDALFDQVYEKAPIVYGVDLAYKVMPTVEVFLHTDYYKQDGQTTWTQETTTLKIFPLELGVRLFANFMKQKDTKIKLHPYVGAGAGYYMVKEENPIGDWDEKGLGFFIEGGFRVVFSSIFVDLKFKNIMLKVDHAQGGDVKMGGFAILGGLGVTF